MDALPDPATIRAKNTALSDVGRVRHLPLGTGCNFNTGQVLGAESRADSTQQLAIAGFEETMVPPWLIDSTPAAQLPEGSPSPTLLPKTEARQLSCNKSFSSTSSSSQFAKFFSLDAGGGISVGGLVGASVSYHEVESFASQSNSEFYSYSAEVTTGWRSMRHPQKLRLTDEARLLYESDASSFTRLYGTHFLFAMPSVHRFQASLRVTRYAEQYLHSKSLEVKVKVLFWSFSFTINLLFEQHSIDTTQISLYVKDTITGAEISRTIPGGKSTLEEVMPEFIQALREEDTVFTKEDLEDILGGSIGHSLDALYRNYSYYAARAAGAGSFAPGLAGAVWVPYETVVTFPGAEARIGPVTLGPSVLPTLHEFAQATRILLQRVDAIMGEPPALTFIQDQLKKAGAEAEKVRPGDPPGGAEPGPPPPKPAEKPPTPGRPNRRPRPPFHIPPRPHARIPPAQPVVRPGPLPPGRFRPRIPLPHFRVPPPTAPRPPPVLPRPGPRPRINNHRRPPPPHPAPPVPPPGPSDPPTPPRGPSEPPSPVSGFSKLDEPPFFNFPSAVQSGDKPPDFRPGTEVALSVAQTITAAEAKPGTADGLESDSKSAAHIQTLLDLAGVKIALTALRKRLVQRQAVLEGKDRDLRALRISPDELWRFLTEDLELIAELFTTVPYAVTPMLQI